MLVSQGKVLSPGNEGSMAVNVYVSIFPQLCFICVHMSISGLSFLVQILYMPAIVRQSMCCHLDWIVDWVIPVFVGSGCCSGLKEDYIFYIFGFWTLEFEECNR